MTRTKAVARSLSILILLLVSAGVIVAFLVLRTQKDDVAPVAEAGSDQTVEFGDKVTVDGSKSVDNVGIVSYSWDFGDGNRREGAVVSYTYATIGDFQVTLRVKDAAGNEGIDRCTIRVVDTKPPTAIISANATQTYYDVESGATESIAFSGEKSADNFGVTGYSWDFGDGRTGTGKAVVHRFGAAGTYTVTLTVTDASSNKGSTSIKIEVESVIFIPVP